MHQKISHNSKFVSLKTLKKKYPRVGSDDLQGILTTLGFTPARIPYTDIEGVPSVEDQPKRPLYTKPKAI